MTKKIKTNFKEKNQAVVRLDKSSRFTPCEAFEKNVGKPPCVHLVGKEYLLSSWSSEDEFFNNKDNSKLLNNLAREAAKNNLKIKEEVPTEIVEAINENKDEKFNLIVAATGVGKSSIIHSAMYDDMRDEEGNLVNEGIIIVPRNELKGQFEKYGMHKRNGFNIITYQTLLEWQKAKEDGEVYNLGLDISNCHSISLNMKKGWNFRPFLFHARDYDAIR